MKKNIKNKYLTIVTKQTNNLTDHLYCLIKENSKLYLIKKKQKKIKSSLLINRKDKIIADLINIMHFVSHNLPNSSKKNT